MQTLNRRPSESLSLSRLVRSSNGLLIRAAHAVLHPVSRYRNTTIHIFVLDILYDDRSRDIRSAVGCSGNHGRWLTRFTNLHLLSQKTSTKKITIALIKNTGCSTEVLPQRCMQTAIDERPWYFQCCPRQRPSVGVSPVGSSSNSSFIYMRYALQIAHYQTAVIEESKYAKAWYGSVLLPFSIRFLNVTAL